MNMYPSSSIAAAAAFAHLLVLSSCSAQGYVTGVLVDEAGAPIENGAYRAWAHREPSRHVQILDTSTPTWSFTDKEGLFSIPWTHADAVMDLEFDRSAYAPAFVLDVHTADPPLKIVMTKGKLVRGQIVDKNGIPVAHTIVHLQLGCCYQKAATTDELGCFQFRVSRPQGGSRWGLKCGGILCPLPEYDQMPPESVVEVRVEVTLRLNASALPGTPNR
jgi:hypothetical protein